MAKGMKRKIPPTISQQVQETPSSSAQSEKCDNCNSKESSALESSANGSSGTALDMENATKVKKKQIISESCDATQKLKEKTSSLLKIVEIGIQREMYHEELMGSIPTSLVEMKHNVPLENMGSDPMKNNVPPEMISLDVKLMGNSFQARGENQIENKNNLHLENDMLSKDDDSSISLHAVQDSPVDGASIGHLNNVYSSKKKKAECAIDEGRVHKDIDGTIHNVLLGNIDVDLMKNNAPPNMHPLDKKLINSSFQAIEREDSQFKMKNYLPSENDMKTIIDDPNTSLLSVQDSPVDSASVSCLKKLYTSKKKMKRKAEWTAHEDQVCKNSSTIDLLHECLVEKSVDELNSFQIDVKECNASKEEKMEVSLTDCKEEASPLPSGYGILLKVVDTDAVNISASGCGDDKELASTRENIMEEKNGDNFCNLPSAVPECDLVEANLESCLTDCQRGAKSNTENGGSGQEKLLDLSLPPEKAPLSCNRSRRKLLILDLNGLLVDMINYQSNWRKPHTIIGGKSVYKRPFCDDFLKFCFERFDVGIWTSRTKKNMHAVINFLMRDDICKLLFFWDQSQCTSTGFTTIENQNKPLFLKELKKIWNREVPSLPWEKGDYTPSNTLLLDDSPYKALRNPPYTAIFPSPYSFKYLSDNSLGPEGDLRVYLEGLAKSDDVPRYVQEHPFGQRAITSSNASWKFYEKVLGVENSSSQAL